LWLPFNYYTPLFVPCVCNVKIILYVVMYCIYLTNIISLPTTTQGCLFFWKCMRLSELKSASGLAACWITRVWILAGTLFFTTVQNTWVPPTHWVLHPTVECLEAELALWSPRSAKVKNALNCNCILPYLLTPWSRVLLEKLTGLQLVKKFPEFYGTQRFINAFTISATCPYPEPAQSSPYPHITLCEDPS
jgi:hypothetical protein